MECFSRFGRENIFDEELPIPDEVKDAIQREWETKGADYSLFTDENALKDDEMASVSKQWKNGQSIKFPPIWYSHPLPLIRESMQPKCVGGNVRAESEGSGTGASFIITIPNRP